MKHLLLLDNKQNILYTHNVFAAMDMQGLNIQLQK